MVNITRDEPLALLDAIACALDKRVTVVHSIIAADGRVIARLSRGERLPLHLRRHDTPEPEGE